jgi:hypothetical protein
MDRHIQKEDVSKTQVISMQLLAIIVRPSLPLQYCHVVDNTVTKTKATATNTTTTTTTTTIIPIVQ